MKSERNASPGYILEALEILTHYMPLTKKIEDLGKYVGHLGRDPSGIYIETSRKTDFYFILTGSLKRCGPGRAGARGLHSQRSAKPLGNVWSETALIA